MNDFVPGIFVGFGIGFMLFLMTLDSALNIGYKEGQMDYANEKVMIERVENEKGELVWQWVDKKKYNYKYPGD